METGQRGFMMSGDQISRTLQPGITTADETG